MGIGGHQHSGGARVYGDGQGILCLPLAAAAFASHYDWFLSCGLGGKTAKAELEEWGSDDQRQETEPPDAQQAGGEWVQVPGF